MPKESMPKVALRWTPPGSMKPGRPNTTWRKTVMAGLEEMGLSWGEALAATKDRTLWSCVALCPTGDEEDKQISKGVNEGMSEGVKDWRSA